MKFSPFAARSLPLALCSFLWGAAAFAEPAPAKHVAHAAGAFSYAMLKAPYLVEDFRHLHPQTTCEDIADGRIYCEIPAPGTRPMFHGAQVKGAWMTGPAASTQLDTLNIETTFRSTFTIQAVEKNWGLQGRCIDGAQTHDVDAAGIGIAFKYLQLLRADNLLPDGMGEFLCMDRSGRALFVIVTQGMAEPLAQFARIFALTPVQKVLIEDLLLFFPKEYEQARKERRR